MRRELTVYVRDPTDTTEGRLSELVASCGASVQGITPEELTHGYVPHVIVMVGEQDSLDAVMRLFIDGVPDLNIGQVSSRDT